MREAALDDPALASQTGAVGDAAAGDEVRDVPGAQDAPVLVVVIASVGEDHVGFLSGATNLPGDRPGVQLVQQRDQLGHVVAVAAGQRNRQRDAVGVDEQVVL